MSSPNKLADNAAYQNRLRDKGWRRINVWLSPLASSLLAALSPRYGSGAKTIEAALRKLNEDPS